MTAPIHLRTALAALILLLLATAGLPWGLRALLNSKCRDLLLQPGTPKELGVFLQRTAFESPAVLPIYGSSEMREYRPNRPDEAFKDAPTGFQVAIAGQAGNQCLPIAQKLAAVGPALNGRKVAVVVSPSWFRRRGGIIPDRFAGNFSALQAIKIARSTSLGPELGARFARRMLYYPHALEQCPEVVPVLRTLTGKQKKSGWKAALQRQMLALKEWELTVADYYNSLSALFTPPEVGEDRLPYDPKLNPFEAGYVPPPAPYLEKAGWDDDYMEMANSSPEWTDFEILLDTILHFKANVLVVTIPIDADLDDERGVSLKSRRTTYYERVAAICAKRQVKFVEYPADDRNAAFLTAHISHPSILGWSRINPALDAFFHDKPFAPPPAVSPPSMFSQSPSPAVSKPAPVAPADDLFAHAKPGDEKTFPLPGGSTIAFRFCPAGSFTMGSPATESGRDADEGPVPVHFTNGFWLARTECTQGQWAALLPLPSENKLGRDLPVEGVTWKKAREWVKKLHQTLDLPRGWKAALPTEAQWEYACRAGNDSPFSLGNNLNASTANCYAIDAGGTPLKMVAAVGSYKPNAWGIHDMHGNVWEWCADWYSPVLAGGTDPAGVVNGKYRVIRGGAWANYPVHCRSASRSYCLPDIPNTRVGFRVALVFQGF